MYILLLLRFSAPLPFKPSKFATVSTQALSSSKNRLSQNGINSSSLSLQQQRTKKPRGAIDSLASSTGIISLPDYLAEKFQEISDALLYFSVEKNVKRIKLFYEKS